MVARRQLRELSAVEAAVLLVPRTMTLRKSQRLMKIDIRARSRAELES